ncbi:hypothetical protein [Frankia sp. Cr2]|uniref:hypothetical protein n=1 Tax=Frankia sp. Cr2 TaxID=3073932 RepID=UPI002AD295D1|nr:hypothetical protein [Frankia sp. Cr2]
MTDTPKNDGSVQPAVLTIGYKAETFKQTAIFCMMLLAVTAAFGFFVMTDFYQPLFVVLFLLNVSATALIEFLCLRAAWRAFRGFPLLTFDVERVTLHSARVYLAWSDVAEIRIARIVRKGRIHDMIVFIPVDADRAMAGLRGLRRQFAREGIKHFGSPVYLRVADLTLPLDDVVTAAQRLTAAPVRHHYDPWLTSF